MFDATLTIEVSFEDSGMCDDRSCRRPVNLWHVNTYISIYRSLITRLRASAKSYARLINNKGRRPCKASLYLSELMSRYMYGWIRILLILSTTHRRTTCWRKRPCLPLKHSACDDESLLARWRFSRSPLYVFTNITVRIHRKENPRQHLLLWVRNKIQPF